LAVKRDAEAETQRDILDRKLTELTLLAKKLCPEAKVEANTVRYEDEDGRLKVFPPPGLSEIEEETLEETLVEKCIEIFDETGLFIVSAAFDSN
jgi:hypothetical protein